MGRSLDELFEEGSKSEAFVDGYAEAAGLKRLSEMTEDEMGVIEKVTRLDLPCVQRLMTLGFVEGSTVKYIGSALGGDPIEVRIEGSLMSLNSECASHFLIKA